MPLIVNMTENLIKRNNPQIIYREVMENLEGNELNRYEVITKLLIRMGYSLKDGYPKRNDDRRLEWIFIKNGSEETLNEESIFEHEVIKSASRWERMDIANDKILTPEMVKRIVENSKKK